MEKQIAFMDELIERFLSLGQPSDVAFDIIQNYRLKRLLIKESETIKYQDRILGIERRWDSLMKRRSEPKRAVCKVDVLGNMPNN